jgi:hypothetical protein
MEGGVCATFSGPSSSRKTAPMFVGLIERKAWGRGSPRPLSLRIGQFNSDAAACFGRHKFNRLANTALKGAEAASAGLGFMLTRRDETGPQRHVAGRRRRSPMPQLGLSRVVTSPKSQHMQANLFRPSLALAHESTTT